MNRIGPLKIKPVNLEVKQVDILMGTSMAPLETYETSVTSVCGNFKMSVNLIKVEKGELLTIDNYEAVIAKYPHLKSRGRSSRCCGQSSSLTSSLIMGWEGSVGS